MPAGDVNPTWEAEPARQRHARDNPVLRMTLVQGRPDSAPVRNLHHHYQVAADNYYVSGLYHRPVTHQEETVLSPTVVAAYRSHEMGLDPGSFSQYPLCLGPL